MKRTKTRRGFGHSDYSCLVGTFLLFSTLGFALPLVRVASEAGWAWWSILLIFPVVLPAVFVYFLVIPNVIARAGYHVARLLKCRESENVYSILFVATWAVLLFGPLVWAIIVGIVAGSET